MNFYLEDETIKTKREKAEAKHSRYFTQWVQEQDKAKKEQYQELESRWYRKTYNVENGCFRTEDDLDWGLASWLKHNIDPKAQTESGLEPFYSETKDELETKREAVIDSAASRSRLVKTIGRWYQKALTFKDKESVAMASTLKVGKGGQKHWVREKQMLSADMTNYYIGELEELLKLAELAHETHSPIRVMPYHDWGF